MDLLCSQVLQPFPTPGSDTLWVAGESLRDRRVSCLPRWTVCPTRTPSLGQNRSTCRGECSWSGPLATPPGRCHNGPLANGPGRIPPFCVCSGGADMVTGGGGETPEVGPLARVCCGPLASCPPLLLCWLRWWVFRAAPRRSRPSCLCVCPRHSWLGAAAGGGGWSLATPG